MLLNFYCSIFPHWLMIILGIFSIQKDRYYQVSGFLEGSMYH